MCQMSTEKRVQVSWPLSSSRSNEAPLDRANMNKPEQEQHDLMADLGLGDFETWQQCSDRQRQMAHRLKNADGRGLGGSSGKTVNQISARAHRADSQVHDFGSIRENILCRLLVHGLKSQRRCYLDGHA
jgi:hypothetical protein